MFAGLLAGVTTWFKAPINIAIAVVFGLLLGVLGIQWVEKVRAQHSVTTLTTKLSTVETELATANATIKVKTNAIAALEQAQKDAESIATIERSVQQEVTSAPSSEDAPVAPVLRKSLDGVARMLHRSR